MFKIEKPEMINKTFRLPAELVERLQTVAQNQGVSLNNLVKQCCEYALNNLEKKKKYFFRIFVDRNVHKIVK